MRHCAQALRVLLRLSVKMPMISEPPTQCSHSDRGRKQSAHRSTGAVGAELVTSHLDQQALR
jgi:hypothetical protein